MSEQDNLREFMTTTEAAKMLGIHPSTAGQYCQAGELEAVKVGVAWAIKRASVERLAAARRVDTSRYTLTTKEAAKRLKLTQKTTIHLCEQGALTAVKDGSMWRITPESVDAYKNRGENPSQHKPAPQPHKRVSKLPLVETEQVQWTAPEPWDWSANVRATWDDKVQAAIRQLRGPGQ